MSMLAGPITQDEEVARLRREYDASFAQAGAPKSDALVEMIGLRVGAARYAVRRREVAAIVALSRVVPVPGMHDGVLGITHVRGHVVAVCDLGARLGAQSAPNERRFLMLSGEEPSLGFSFDELTGLLRVTEDALRTDSATASSEASTTSRTSTLLHLDGAVLPVIDLAALVAEAKRPLSQAQHAQKET